MKKKFFAARQIADGEYIYPVTARDFIDAIIGIVDKKLGISQKNGNGG